MKFQRLPVEVDPFRLVEQGRELVGKLPVTDFSRLQDLLFYKTDQDRQQDQSVIDVQLNFDRNERGLPIIHGSIRSDLNLNCQRCLNLLEMPFESEFSVVLVTTDVQADTLQEGFDTWLVEDNCLFVQDFIEDEILLALPLALSHEQCEPERELIEALPSSVDTANGEEILEEAEEKENPFAVLKNLKLKQ
ncbi:Large ribosomal RNA subunit accumulation protein YceD [Nymphon striatum]|nr:Large ribosomal RNA subunit accumulation protein YceD [Nymphon striatum]